MQDTVLGIMSDLTVIKRHSLFTKNGYRERAIGLLKRVFAYGQKSFVLEIMFESILVIDRVC